METQDFASLQSGLIEYQYFIFIALTFIIVARYYNNLNSIMMI